MACQYMRFGGRCYLRPDQNLLATLARTPVLFFKHVGRRSSLRLLLHQWGIRKKRPAVELPVCGDACVAAQRGYTVFNFKKNTVTQIFNPPIDAGEFKAYEAKLMKASRLSFVPQVVDVSTCEQWLEMDYVPGRDGRSLLASNPRHFVPVFRSKLLPCLRELIMSEYLRFIPLDQYVCGLLPTLEDESLGEWPDVQHRLRAFVDRLSGRLLDTTNIALGYTHGDLVHVNLIDSRNGVRVIDWDTAGWRSVLHDVHTFFFSQLYWRRDIPLPRGILEEAVRDFVSAPPEPTDTISLTPNALDAYRRIYYLERLAMLLRRKNNRNRADHLMASISIYEKFEQLREEQS